MQLIKEKISLENLRKGLIALSNAGNIGWFEGHFGAAIIAGEFLIAEQNISSDVASEIRKHINLIIKSNPDLFKETEDDTIDPEWKNRIANSLNKNVDKLRTSAHGVIYSALALQAFELKKDLAKQAIITGITKLLELTTKDSLDRYYDVSNYDLVEIKAEDNIPVYTNENELIKITFDELNTVYPDQNIDGKTYFFHGEKIHLVTHAHALCLLNKFGFSDVVKKGYGVHRLQVKLARQKPPDLKEIKVNKLYDPLKVEYWTRELTDPHSIKFPYSALALTTKVSNQKEEYRKVVERMWS